MRRILTTWSVQQNCHPTTICTWINQRRKTKDWGGRSYSSSRTLFPQSSQFCKEQHTPIHCSASDISFREQWLAGYCVCCITRQKQNHKMSNAFSNSYLESRKTYYYFVKMSYHGSLSPLTLYGLQFINVNAHSFYRVVWYFITYQLRVQIKF